MDMTAISVVGSGYVGLVTAAGFAALGFRTICADIDEKKVEMINRGIPPIREEHLDEILRKLGPERISATKDIRDAVRKSSVTFICVNTPVKEDGGISLENIRAASEEIGLALREKKKPHLIIVKSTVPPGTTEEIVIREIERLSKKRFGTDFGVVMSPEFLREGRALLDFLSPSRIVLGSSDRRSILAARRLYAWAKCPIIECGFREAEMAKYASNAFLAAKISFINEIGRICKKCGADTNTVAEVMGLDPRIGRDFLSPGIGFGGSCLPKDLRMLIKYSESEGINPKLLKAVLDVNKAQVELLTKILKERGILRRGARIGVLGLSFKAGTDDVRESQAISAVKIILKEGASVIAYDPLGMENARKTPEGSRMNYAEDARSVIEESEAVLILTEWEEFKKLDFNDKIVIDCKNLFGREVKRPKNYIGLNW